MCNALLLSVLLVTHLVMSDGRIAMSIVWQACTLFGKHAHCSRLHVHTELLQCHRVQVYTQRQAFAFHGHADPNALHPAEGESCYSLCHC